jgi:hypothetical protein
MAMTAAVNTATRSVGRHDRIDLVEDARSPIHRAVVLIATFPLQQHARAAPGDATVATAVVPPAEVERSHYSSATRKLQLMQGGVDVQRLSTSRQSKHARSSISVVKGRNAVEADKARTANSGQITTKHILTHPLTHPSAIATATTTPPALCFRATSTENAK